MLYKYTLLSTDTQNEIKAKKQEKKVNCYMFHGVLGSGFNLLSVTKMIDTFVSPILFDLPNHGKSPHVNPGNFSHTSACIDDSIVLEQKNTIHDSYALLGHSLGAKYAMIHALQNPTKVSSLVVMDIAPMTYPSYNRIYIEAYKKVLLKKPTNRKEAVQCLSEFVDDQAYLFFLAKNFYFEDTTLKLHINLDALDTHYENLSGFPQELNNFQYDGPTLFLRAETSDYFDDSAEQYIKQYFTQYTIVTIPNSTHILHIDNPTEVQRALNDFYLQHYLQSL